MRATEAIQLTEATARDLRAQGQAERATAIEQVLSIVAATLGGPVDGAPSVYLTPAQTARMLGADAQLVRRLVATGELPGERLGKRLFLNRDAVIAYLERTSAAPLPVPASPADQSASRQELHQRVLNGLPKDQVLRHAALHDKLEAGAGLTRSEREELTALDQSIAQASAKGLATLIKRSDPPRP
jgi:excisionase family DNA binding protein